MYKHVDPDRSEMKIEVLGINVQMSRRFAKDLKLAIWKALTLERKDISNSTYEPQHKQALIELMDRLDKVESAERYTTSERDQLSDRVKSSYRLGEENE